MPFKGSRKKYKHNISREENTSVKIREEITEIETKKTIENINENWVGSLKIDKCLAKLINKKKREPKSIKFHFSENEKEVKFNSIELQRILRVYWWQLYDNKMEKLNEMDKFLVVYNPQHWITK